MSEITRETIKKRLHLARLNKKMTKLVAEKGSLTDLVVVAFSRRMNKVAVEIMKAETVPSKRKPNLMEEEFGEHWPYIVSV